MNYGYIRVSSKEQNIERQKKRMLEYGVQPDCIYVDYQSGKDFNRPSYQKLIKKVRTGDCIIVHSIDRLGRNYDEILYQWRYLTKEKKVYMQVLDFPLLNTNQPDEGLMKTFIADLVLQILSYVAQVERENSKRRQAEGIAIAKAKGKHLGRPSIPIPEHFEEIVQLKQSQSIDTSEAARRLGVSRTTFQRWMQTYK